MYQSHAQHTDQLYPRFQQLGRVVVDDACNIGHNAGYVGDHGRQAVDKPLCHVQDELDAGVYQLPRIGPQPAGQVGRNGQRLCQQLRDARNHSLPQLGHQIDAALQQLRPYVGGQVCENAAQPLGQTGKAAAGKAIRKGLQVAAGQAHSCAQLAADRIKQRNAQVGSVGFQALHPVGHRVGHGGVGRLGRTAAVLHLGQHIVELLRAGVRQRECTRTGFHAGPQRRKLGGIAAHAVIQHLQHIAQALAAIHQFSKALAGLFLQDLAHGRAGVAQLVQHGLGIGGGLGGSNTVGRHNGQAAGQVFHVHLVGCRQRDDPAHAGR